MSKAQRPETRDSELGTRDSRLGTRDSELGTSKEKAMARGSAEQQMEAAAHTYFDRVTKGDVDGILSLFADDAQLINPMTGEAGIKGKAALRAFYQNLVNSLVDYHA